MIKPIFDIILISKVSIEVQINVCTPKLNICWEIFSSVDDCKLLSFIIN